MQTRAHAMLEVALNIGTGFLISLLIQQYAITPLFNLPTSASSNFTITVIFTVVSIVRSYVFRRLFNRLGRPKC